MVNTLGCQPIDESSILSQTVLQSVLYQSFELSNINYLGDVNGIHASSNLALIIVGHSLPLASCVLYGC